MPSRHVVIAGAGIGGLTAALALARQGVSSVILERAAALQPIGAGVQLSPNASRILIGLGLHDALAARATRPTAVVLNSVRAGGTIARLPLPLATKAPYWVIHRADLQTVLHAAVAAHPSIALRLDTTIAGFSASVGGVDIALDHQTIEAAALIGADGVGSQIRQKLFPSASPRSSGRVAWRGVAEAAGPSEVALWMGPHAHLVAYPVAGGARTNIVVTRYDNAGATSLSGKAVATQLGHAGWPDAPRALIASAETLTPYPLFTVPKLAAWHCGAVVLLGDAAHAMLPFAAQGAAMAIEDAAVLANCFGTDDDVAAALARYTASRRPRVARVAKAAEQSGRIYHLDGAMAFARDTTIRLLGGTLLLKRQDWIYDWTL